MYWVVMPVGGSCSCDMDELAEAIRRERSDIADWLLLALGVDLLFGIGPTWLVSLLLGLADSQRDPLAIAVCLWIGSMIGLAIPAIWFRWTSRSRQ